MFHPLFFAPLSLFFLLFHLTSADLDDLRRLQRKCYRDINPCVMFMNEQKAFGCGQCGDDVRSEPLREFRSVDELILFINGESEKRIVMIPEFIFFSGTVVARLAAASTNVAAVIVFDGPGDAIDVPEQANGGPFEPMIIRSDDETEPNRRYNYYNLTELPPRCDEVSQDERNPNAFCLKNSFFPFNVFHVNASVADEIRFLAARFPDQSDRPLPGGRNSTSPFAPRYKVDSVGQMFSCPIQPLPTPNVEEASEESATQTEIPVTSEKCLRDRTCLPIGGHSLWSSLDHLDATSPVSKNILAITAPMDSIAFFNDLALGASAEVTSLAIMMAVAEAVAKYKGEKGAEKEMLRLPVYFAWNAQSWGYAGSSRFLKDVRDFECDEEGDLTKFTSGCVRPYMPNLKFRDFREATFSVLNIGQMISPNRTDAPIESRFFVHGRDPDDENKGEVEQALERAFSDHESFHTDGLHLGHEGDFTDYVPLDASQSFRRYRPDVDMITIANYNTTFTNTFYHSIYDNQSKTESPKALRDPMYAAAEAIASAVVSLAFGDTAPISINTTLIDEAVICLTGNWTRCDLRRDYLGKVFESQVGQVIPGNYPGSFFPITRLLHRNPSGAAKLSLIRNFFAYHNRYEVPEEEVSCETVDDCKDFLTQINTRISPQTHSELRSAFCTRGKCVASDTYTHNAYGTALNATNDAQSSFEYDVRKLKEEFNLTDPQEAGWTESVWDPELGLCGFVEDTALYGGLILLAGFLVLGLSVIFSLWLDRIMFIKSPEVLEETVPLPQATAV